MLFALLISYFIIINIVAISVTIIDKAKAQSNGWRISEATLFIISIIGGAIGMYITMHLIHHKTRKTKFMIGIPTIFIIELLLLTITYFMIGVNL